MSTVVFLSEPTRYLTGSNYWVWAKEVEELLLGVVLDDELFLDRQLDLRADWEGVHEDAHPTGDGLEPGRDDPLAVGLTSHDERGHVPALLAHVDHVVGG